MMNNTLIRNLTLATTLLSGAALAAPLSVTVYNPGEKAIFPVSSSLVTGDKEAILIDAMFELPSTDQKSIVITRDYAAEKLSHSTLSTLKAA